ncbi:hypothetical protein CINS5915_03030 [Campylobacter insulaenigrae]|uniref:Uncharacterized protein n=1 Tax=Campylobacter insulaenigrae TaxID=260714 RepID=A0ABY3G6I5_9BACT|nr:hypothetical protein [Campylobacter insulaenigrae]MCR6570854.1 hypothetical protein [Campylobacter insulaenigrae]MCR6572488.1 hypothetical protein [Campylobacter insulaenigrae]MCR6575341.1 hypothetical protein [Campylobacter insulaenigrae]MCR6578397.1 hypothetical protein [Campylobacter insulaenigrae]MCR6581364.1 hypothetical protein [Campylobacter insulaenigrae]
MNFLEELKGIKKELQKEINIKKNKNKSSANGASIKKSDLNLMQKELSLKNEENKQKKEFEDIFLKEERLANEFMDFVKNSDIKKIK